MQEAKSLRDTASADHVGLTRRNFLKATALAGTVAVTGTTGCFSSIIFTDAQVETDEHECATFCKGCLGCPMVATVRDDNLVAVRSAEVVSSDFPDVRRMCARGAAVPTGVVQDKRIKYPMKRVDGTERGAGQWERISWDEAIETICGKIMEYQSEYGKDSVCVCAGGPYEPRHLWNLNRLIAVAGFTDMKRNTDMAVNAGLLDSAGGYFLHTGADPDIINGLKALVIWGHNPCVSWPIMWRYIAEAREKNGCKLIVVDPNYNTIAQKADLFVPIRQGTDGVLALGIINYLEENGLVNDEYMKVKSSAPFLVKKSDGLFLRKSDLDLSVSVTDKTNQDFAVWDEATDTLGYANTAGSPAIRKGSFEVGGFEVTPAYDLLCELVAEFPLDRTSEITGVPEETIVEFASLISRIAPVEIMQGYGLDHYTNGYNTIVATSAVRIVCGMVQGARFPYSTGVSGFTPAEANHPNKGRNLANFMFHDLVDKGEYTFPDGSVVKNSLKMLMTLGGNQLNSNPDRNDTVAAYKKIDFVVASNIEWCDTADVADIVLPAAMDQESLAVDSGGGCVWFAEQCITPRFEAKTDFDIARLIGQGIGLGEWFQEDMDAAMAHVVETGSVAAAGVTYDRLKKEKVIYVGPMKLPAYSTGTGRLNFYIEKATDMQRLGNKVVMGDSHLPVWKPPVEAWPKTIGGFEKNPIANKYPLCLLAGTRRFRVHSWFGQNPLLREMEINEPCVRINPQDAEERGISDGDYVRLFNDRGEAVMKAFLSAGIRPGGVDADRGWQASQYIKGCVQELTSKAMREWYCPNYAYDDALVQMEKWEI